VRLTLTPPGGNESQAEETASLFPADPVLAPHERKIFSLLKADEATHIDEIVERLEAEMSSEIFAALFALDWQARYDSCRGRIL
jgi:hypothetical protein